MNYQSLEGPLIIVENADKKVDERDNAHIIK